MRAIRHKIENIIIDMYPYSAGNPNLKNMYVAGKAIILRLPTIIWYFFICPVANIAVYKH